MNRKTIILGISLVLLLIKFFPSWQAKLLPAGSLLSTTPQATISTSPSTPTSQTLGVQTKSANCQAAGALPDSACTPGAIIASATKEQICISGYSKSVRNVPTAIKNQVFAEYGIPTHSPGQYEVDHLISLELGGSNDITNLWPELADPLPGYHEKDAVENYLHAQVCSGAISLQVAQQQIAQNWLAIYKQMPATHP